MALRDCPDCRREVSTLAKACPHCGFPLGEYSDAAGVMPERGPSRWMDPGFWIILTAVTVTIILSVLILTRGAG